MQLIYLNNDHKEDVVETVDYMVSDGVTEKKATLWTSTLDINPTILETYITTSKYIVITSENIEDIEPWLDLFPKRVIVVIPFNLQVAKFVEEKSGFCLQGDVKKNLIYIIINL